MTVIPRHRAAPEPLARRIVSALGSALLTLAAVLGVLCLVMLVLSLTMHLSLILFSTGSMEPTIPAGSAALVQEIRGDEIEVGDVLTVDRPGELPVTHRVIEILEVQGETATFVMQGDANEDPDLEPYTASQVRIVLGSVPGVANAVASLQNPVVLGGLTLGATLLVTWAFWPRRDERRHEEPEAD